MNIAHSASIIVCLLIISAGCRKTSTPPPPPAATEVTPSPQLSHSAGGATPAAQTKFFKGSIGTSLDLQMKLVRTGDQLAGSYFYQKVGSRINLRGNVDKDGNLTLEEFDPARQTDWCVQRHLAVDAQDGLITLAGTGPSRRMKKEATRRQRFQFTKSRLLSRATSSWRRSRSRKLTRS